MIMTIIIAYLYILIVIIHLRFDVVKGPYVITFTHFIYYVNMYGFCAVCGTEQLSARGHTRIEHIFRFASNYYCSELSFLQPNQYLKHLCSGKKHCDGSGSGCTCADKVCIFISLFSFYCIFLLVLLVPHIQINIFDIFNGI